MKQIIKDLERTIQNEEQKNGKYLCLFLSIGTAKKILYALRENERLINERKTIRTL